MNSRYICKAKRKDNGKWVEGYYVCLNENCHRIYTDYAEKDCGDYCPEYCEVIPETIRRCIGLKDKNGKLIFEGDILKLGTGKTRFVFYGVSSFRHTAYNEYAKEFDFKDKGYQVIGNTHDNPELLEVKE